MNQASSAHIGRRRQLLLVLLAFNSGATDAIGFIGLGGAFTSVMTGNMILLGVSGPNSDGALAVRSASAIVLFMVGTFLGAQIAGSPRSGDPVWPRRVWWALFAELVVLVIEALGWWGNDGHPTGSWQPILLGADAIALGIQSSAIVRFGVSGLSTTYMTGTLTAVVSGLAHGRHPRNLLPSTEILLALVAGATTATLLVRHAPLLTPAIQLIPVGSVLIAVASARAQFEATDTAPQQEGAQPSPA